MSGRSIGLSGLYYFAPSDSFEPFVKLGVSAWNAQAKFSAFQYDNAGALKLFQKKVNGKLVINDS
jgi:hypothetical protein